MLCERCKERDATVHLTEIIKNVKSEIHLCEVCAREIGLNAQLSSFSLSVPDMLSFLDVHEIDEHGDTTACASCGFTFTDYKKSGKLGCPECYRHLRASLHSVLSNYHGTPQHVGKVPANFIEQGNRGLMLLEKKGKSSTATMTLQELKKKMQKAVREERYEEAAVLRDEIQSLESGDNE